MTGIVNVPYKSKWIGGMYAFLTVFIALLYFFGESYTLHVLFDGIMIFVFTLMLSITASFYTTKYRIENGFLKSWSPFMNINLRIRDIKKVEKTMVPFHFRIGSSLYSGAFYTPNIGWVRSIITNLRDAILITMKDDKHYTEVILYMLYENIYMKS